MCENLVHVATTRGDGMAMKEMISVRLLYQRPQQELLIDYLGDTINSSAAM